MLKPIPLLLLFGITFRIVLFALNPPTNSYDNHREPIAIYAHSFARPAPADCWECYQPPAYYYLAAAVFKLSQSVGLTESASWKCVQSINTLLSILLLILFYRLISQFPISQKTKLLYLSFIIILPRDIFTSAMIGNDYLLVFATLSALYYYIKCIKSFENSNKKTLLIHYIILSLYTLLGCFTKQHGILLIILPTAIPLLYLHRNKRYSLTILLPILLCIIAIASTEEIRNYNLTGKILVSNQHLFENANQQFPGTLDKVQFFTFRIFNLFQQPFISYSTAASLPTSLFASTFFDYEWKFLTPENILSIITGRLAYLLGISWMKYFVSTTFSFLKKKYATHFNWNIQSFYYIIPVVLGVCFMAVPVLQTIRFPHYSSMKSTFMLPGIFILIALHPLVTSTVSVRDNNNRNLIRLNIVFGVLLLVALFMLIDFAISHPLKVIGQ